MLTRRTLLSAGLAAPLLSARALAADPSAGRSALRDWKLQIPGPEDIRDLSRYSSRYFQVGDDGALRFWVDCAEKGSTANSTFVRSELRHRADWKLRADARRSLAARIAVASKASPDKVTVMQIHGETDDGKNAPPLLRVAVDGGDVIAHVKTDASGDNTEHVPLLPGIGANEFACRILVEGRSLAIDVNGAEKLRLDLTFWPYANYFKLGLYPQAHQGEVVVTARDIAVTA